MNKPLEIVDVHGRTLPVVTLDFETYYSTKDKYSLRKMTATEYVRHPLFKAHGLSYIMPDGTTGWITHANLQAWFDSIDWTSTAMLAQNCVTGDHEVMTLNGWKRLDLLDGAEHILQWSPKTLAASFTPYVPVSSLYKGRMYKWDTLYHQGIYTPDHRVYYCTPCRSDYSVTNVEQVINKGPNNVYFPTSATHLTGTPVIYDFTAEQARFIEAVRADGSYQKTKNIVYSIRFKFHKERKVSRLIDLCESLKLDYSRRTTTINEYPVTVVNISLAKNADAAWLRDMIAFMPAKHYTSNVVYLSAEAQNAIVEEAVYWDGSGIAIFSSSLEDMEWIQFLAHVNGKNIRLVTRDNNRGWGNKNSVLTCGSIRNKQRVKLQYKPQEINYDGLVYCVTVPDKAFFVRRNGVIWITGNCAFDSLIAHEHYAVKAAYYLDTMSMSYGEWGPALSASLDAICARLEIKGKKAGELEKTDGIRDLTEEQEAALSVYAIQDSVATRQAFELLYFDRGYPEPELHLIDITLKMFANPQLMINAALCKAEIELEDIRMANLLSSDVVKDVDLSDKCRQVLQNKGVEGLMRSRDCFAEMLRARGVEPPLKEKKVKGIVVPDEYTYAFAKNDIELIMLGEDPRVSDIVAMWTGSKSTLRKTRAERFLTNSDNGTKPLPVPLRYCGARTMRWSGCLTEHNNVIIKRQDRIIDVSIKDVRITDLVWDGIEFVSHDGVVDSGLQEVISYAGITGTRNHPVLEQNGKRFTALETAKAKGVTLALGCTPFSSWIEKIRYWVVQIRRSRGSILFWLW